MNYRYCALSILVFLALIFSAGCTAFGGSHATPTPTPTPAPAATETPAVTATPSALQTPSAMVPGPTDEIPDIRSVQVSVQKGGTYQTTITTIFNGGKGLMDTKKVTTLVTAPDGTQATCTIGDENGVHIGDSCDAQGSKGTDRVQVSVLMNDGKTYKVIDKLMPYMVQP